MQHYINNLLSLRGHERSELLPDDLNFNIKFDSLTDDQILSVVLYVIEKKYHFSGDGIWARQDGVKVDSQVN